MSLEKSFFDRELKKRIYFGEKDIGEIGLNFSNKPDKKKIVQDTISRKKYKSYLEIGCFNNDLFNELNSDFKNLIVSPNFLINHIIFLQEMNNHIYKINNETIQAVIL